QVLLNLLQNAVQAMPKGGKISITSSHSQAKDVAALKLKLKDRMLPDVNSEFLTIEVKDNGMGIEKEHLKKIFDPFFTTKEIGKGTGLGLAICYGIISEFGGDIQVLSQPKKGSRFKIILPIG
ncbi:MAG: hypothetical protein KBD78_12605, partial [Oligoflexales bacterium]|nr:hypothetical protein [Oligoflexales bacterium]